MVRASITIMPEIAVLIYVIVGFLDRALIMPIPVCNMQEGNIP